MSTTAAPPLPGGRRQIHLAGFMGSGKSTVGRLVARRLLWNFLDLDGVIERHEGRSIARIFERGGEEHFRGIERHVLRQIAGKPFTVVALGGGTLMDADNRALSAEFAAVVWLRCSLETLEARCGAHSPERPLWDEHDALQRRLDERLPGYQSAEFVVDGSAHPESVADRICAIVTTG